MTLMKDQNVWAFRNYSKFLFYPTQTQPSNMNKEEEMKEVELNEMDQEKQPMTAETPTGTEKNGCVKVKVPEDTEVKFTGLSKEELMKVAGTPGYEYKNTVFIIKSVWRFYIYCRPICVYLS